MRVGVLWNSESLFVVQLCVCESFEEILFAVGPFADSIRIRSIL